MDVRKADKTRTTANSPPPRRGTLEHSSCRSTQEARVRVCVSAGLGRAGPWTTFFLGYAWCDRKYLARHDLQCGYLVRSTLQPSQGAPLQLPPLR